MAAYNKFNCFVQDCAHKQHNLATDTLKLLLSNTLPVATNAVKGDISEITGGGGYLSGGMTLTTSSSGQTGGIYKLVLADLTIIGSGGGFGPFRYTVVYNASSPLLSLIGWQDYGSSITVTALQSFVWDASAINGVLTLQ